MEVDFAIFEHKEKTGERLYFPDSKTANTQLVLSFICKYFMIIVHQLVPMNNRFNDKKIHLNVLVPLWIYHFITTLHYISKIIVKTGKLAGNIHWETQGQGWLVPENSVWNYLWCSWNICWCQMGTGETTSYHLRRIGPSATCMSISNIMK